MSAPITIASVRWWPTVLFLPQASTGGGPFSGYARIVTAQEATIGEVGAGQPTAKARISVDAGRKQTKPFEVGVLYLDPRLRSDQDKRAVRLAPTNEHFCAAQTWKLVPGRVHPVLPTGRRHPCSSLKPSTPYNRPDSSSAAPSAWLRSPRSNCRRFADMKRGGLAAAQLKRHAGGTSLRIGMFFLPTHVTECRVDSPSSARRFVNRFFQNCDKRFPLARGEAA